MSLCPISVGPAMGKYRQGPGWENSVTAAWKARVQPTPGSTGPSAAARWRRCAPRPRRSREVLLIIVGHGAPAYVVWSAWMAAQEVRYRRVDPLLVGPGQEGGAVCIARQHEQSLVGDRRDPVELAAGVGRAVRVVRGRDQQQRHGQAGHVRCDGITPERRLG